MVYTEIQCSVYTQHFICTHYFLRDKSLYCIQCLKLLHTQSLNILAWSQLYSPPIPVTKPRIHFLKCLYINSISSTPFHSKHSRTTFSTWVMVPDIYSLYSNSRLRWVYNSLPRRTGESSPSHTLASTGRWISGRSLCCCGRLFPSPPLPLTTGNDALQLITEHVLLNYTHHISHTIHTLLYYSIPVVTITTGIPSTLHFPHTHFVILQYTSNVHHDRDTFYTSLLAYTLVIM